MGEVEFQSGLWSFVIAVVLSVKALCSDFDLISISILILILSYFSECYRKQCQMWELGELYDGRRAKVMKQRQPRSAAHSLE